jgi:hypothetical protein
LEFGVTEFNSVMDDVGVILSFGDERFQGLCEGIQRIDKKFEEASASEV